MVLQQGLVQKQSQQLTFNQALRQSIKVLRLSNQELAQHIQKELLENPTLELDESGKQSAHTNDMLAAMPYPDSAKNTTSQIERSALTQIFARKDKKSLDVTQHQAIGKSSLATESYSDYYSDYRSSSLTGSRAGAAANSEHKTRVYAKCVAIARKFGRTSVAPVT